LGRKKCVLLWGCLFFCWFFLCFLFWGLEVFIFFGVNMVVLLFFFGFFCCFLDCLFLMLLLSFFFFFVFRCANQSHPLKIKKGKRGGGRSKQREFRSSERGGVGSGGGGGGGGGGGAGGEGGVGGGEGIVCESINSSPKLGWTRRWGQHSKLSSWLWVRFQCMGTFDSTLRREASAIREEESGKGDKRGEFGEGGMQPRVRQRFAILRYWEKKRKKDSQTR